MAVSPEFQDVTRLLEVQKQHVLVAESLQVLHSHSRGGLADRLVARRLVSEVELHGIETGDSVCIYKYLYL